MNIIEGQLIAQDLKIAIVVARFNEFIGLKLVGGAGRPETPWCV